MDVLLLQKGDFLQDKNVLELEVVHVFGNDGHFLAQKLEVQQENGVLVSELVEESSEKLLVLRTEVSVVFVEDHRLLQEQLVFLHPVREIFGARELLPFQVKGQVEKLDETLEVVLVGESLQEELHQLVVLQSLKFALVHHEAWRAEFGEVLCEELEDDEQILGQAWSLFEELILLYEDEIIDEVVAGLMGNLQHGEIRLLVNFAEMHVPEQMLRKNGLLHPGLLVELLSNETADEGQQNEEVLVIEEVFGGLLDQRTQQKQLLEREEIGDELEVLPEVLILDDEVVGVVEMHPEVLESRQLRVLVFEEIVRDVGTVLESLEREEVRSDESLGDLVEERVFALQFFSEEGTVFGVLRHVVEKLLQVQRLTLIVRVFVSPRHDPFVLLLLHQQEKHLEFHFAKSIINY